MKYLFLKIKYINILMINILFYGNCQVWAIQKILHLDFNKYNNTYIPCYTTDYDKSTFTDIINKCDIIITQPINDNYRNNDYLSTKYIIHNSKKNCKIIIFDSCHFDFYYFDLTYKLVNGIILKKPHDYHYNTMMECYKNNYSVEYYIENYINNINLKTSEELEFIAETSLNELKKRYNDNINKYKNYKVYIISIHDFLKNNYKDKLLFYSMNHPTKYVLQYICEQIIDYLKIKNTIDYNVDCLNGTKCILYKCIQKNVNFDINNHEIITLNISNINDITQLYYDTYKEINLL